MKDSTLRAALVEALLLAVAQGVVSMKKAGLVLERWDELVERSSQ